MKILKSQRKNRNSAIPLPKLFARFAKDTSGAIVILFAILLPILVGAIGLAVEVGLWYWDFRNLQSSADAAAVAAIAERSKDPDLGEDDIELRVAAYDVATRNGFTAAYEPDFAEDLFVVNMAPNITTGDYTADAEAVEVILTHPRVGLFSSVFNIDSIDIDARAVASMDGDSDEACFLALDKTANNALNCGGTAKVDMPGCSIQANSESTTGGVNCGGDLELVADCLKGSGAVKSNFNNPANAPDCILDYQPPIPNPFSHLDDALNTLIASSAITPCISVPNGSDITMNPGCYDSKLQLNNGSIVTLNPGIYVFDQSNITVNNGGLLKSNGPVVIIMTDLSGGDGAGNISFTGEVILCAPPGTGTGCSGSFDAADFNGTFGQDWLGYWDQWDSFLIHSNGTSDMTMNGGGTTAIWGTTYGAQSDVKINGNMSGTTNTNGLCFQVVAQVGTINGTELVPHCWTVWRRS